MFGILLSTDMTGASVTNCTLPDYSCRTRSGSTYQATCFMLQTLEKINIQSTYELIYQLDAIFIV